MVLAPVRTRGQLLGLIFADNCYSARRLTKDQLEHVRLYVDQTALVWENLSLLARASRARAHDAHGRPQPACVRDGLEEGAFTFRALPRELCRS